ncbi:hypothetical protein Trydic_g11198 [Trypoxylus dichotomus]
MGDIVQTLAFILPIVATVLVLCVLFIHIYFKIRRRLSVSVNCWFCNEWTKVRYDNYNSFVCPKCLQYNGFDQDGGYNKTLPEQHDELLNQQVPLNQRESGFKLSNGLCHICNNNQRLKIYQLANFVPLNEDAFDEEVEHFQKQLEKAYKLCFECEQVVKQIHTEEKKWLLATKMRMIRDKSHSTTPTNSLSLQTKQSYFLHFLNLILTFFVSLVLILAFTNIALLSQIYKQTFASVILYASSLISVMTNSELIHTVYTYLDFKNLHLDDYLKSLPYHIISPNFSTFPNLTNIDIEDIKALYLQRPHLILLCATGLFVHVTSMLFNRNSLYENIRQLLLWCCLLGIIRGRYIEEYPLLTHTLLVIMSASLICTFISISRKSKGKKKILIRRRNSKTSVQNNASYLGEISDQDDDILSRSASDYASVVNSTFKPKHFHNETDTAESDWSFESLRPYEPVHSSPFREHLRPPRSISPIGSVKSDHVFGKLPTFQCQLTTSSVPFRNIDSRNSVFSNPSLIYSQNINSNLSYKNVNCINSESFSSGRISQCHSNNNFNSTSDLNESLCNLHLSNKACHTGTLSKRAPIKIQKRNVSRPILSPPKFVCTGRNLWLTQNNSWKNFKDAGGYENANVSSSSSQSSGFVSQTNEYSGMRPSSAYLPKKRSPLNDGNSLKESASYSDKFRMYRNSNTPPQCIWRESVKRSLGVPEGKHLLKPIQDSTISSERPYYGCPCLNSVSNSLGQSNLYRCNST